MTEATGTKLVKSTEKRRPPAAGKGRPPGSVNKTTAAVKETLMAAFDGMGGLDALIEWGKENRTPFYQIWAKLLPQEIKGELEINNVTPEERTARIAAIFDAARDRRAREVGDAAE
jgi:hypothetical protein